ncbi:spore maturation protein A [Anoxybacillus sp. B7M1]|jgi:spore maturation protein A|uniref:Nucleoside recognition domain-containing protein n=1 Tax=Anoxybacteroides rupiense TaxID=311460 RepID=A0ABD5IXH8_9BACL|nr:MULTISPECIES: nucleoside recognition domain-containing protein [Anoxybacillus]ANB59044.1 spore maturation protein A [Anoxybacillus sp. B2M1]ANB62589.1 spore maturation protein A [Anoxybacillus sp. B7M1]KXG11118.1 Spore maturation protein A [Anoxybacillus sp. P3H1B]MBB3906694.1 spore maturation protein A [Anoxybacillus rupiensis]MBS2770185.1 spore maturation protein [Anoxybacillus rupiensis]
MVNLIWAMLALVGIVFAMFNGTMNEVNEAVFKGAKEAVTISIGMISILVFWLGLMRIAEHAGLLTKLAHLCKPLVRRLFPEVPADHPAMGYIVSNMIANMFGLGNAATPMGIKAMEELKKLNGNRDTASRSMVTFLAMNTSGITLIPATVISIRMTYESSAPGEIIGTTLVASAISTIGAIFIDRYYYWRRTRGGKR